MTSIGSFCARPPTKTSTIAERYEQAATITSNLDFHEWAQAFPSNRLLASPTVDRLRHNAYFLMLDGPSGRNPKVAPPASHATLAHSSKAAQLSPARCPFSLT